MPLLGTSSPVRNDVKQRLRAAIIQRYQPGDRLPSTRDVSRKLKVAHGTAYRALCELHDEGVIELRPRSGAYVAQHKPHHAPGNADPNLAHYRVAPHVTLGNIFAAEMFEGFQERALRAGLNVEPVLLNPPGVDDTLPPPPTKLPPADATVHFNPTQFSPLVSSADQVMVVATTASELPFIQTSRLDVVSVDQELGGQLAGRAMREMGCEHVYYVGVRNTHGEGLRGYRATCAARLAGFERGWGHAIAPHHLNYQAAYSVPSGMAAFDDYLKLDPRPRGIFCATDELAGGIALRAAAKGMALGRDFELIGFDGQARINIVLGMKLPTIVVPTREMGKRAADMLIERLANPDQPTRRLLLGCTYRSVASPQRASTQSPKST